MGLDKSGQKLAIIEIWLDQYQAGSVADAVGHVRAARGTPALKPINTPDNY